MHCSNFDTESIGRDGGEVLLAIASLVTEGRIPEKLKTKTKGFYEGPHCFLNKNSIDHKCDLTDVLCLNYDNVREHVINLWKKNIPLCIEVVLTCSCKEDLELTSSQPYDDGLLLEKWFININHRRSAEINVFNLIQLVSAIRSQLYFSQLTAWLSVQENDENKTKIIKRRNIRYRLTSPDETVQSVKFSLTAQKHEFPLTDIGNGKTINVTVLSMPRMTTIPKFICNKCEIMEMNNKIKINNYSRINKEQRRYPTICTQKGKHCCEDFEKDIEDDEEEGEEEVVEENKDIDDEEEHFIKNNKESHGASTSNLQTWQNNKINNDLNLTTTTTQPVVTDKGKLLLDAIERSGKKKKSTNVMNENFNGICDMSESDIFSIKNNKRSKYNIYINKICDSPIQPPQSPLNSFCHNSTPITSTNQQQQQQQQQQQRKRGPVRKLSFDDAKNDIPTPSQQLKFRKDLDNAANMVFHSRTGLPLTSSPAPIRRGKSCFDFDSSINSVSAIKSALFPTSFSTDDESESDGSIVSPCSPESNNLEKSSQISTPIKYRRKGHAANLLGSFEESVLNGRLEPVSTVHGFKAELGASGSFVPKHLVVPVTVFFYTLGDNDKVSSPYLSHINLGKKGYNVPKSGTVQVTLFNPLGTVVKMFVIMYDLSDMPPNSQTFIRQRTLYMPTNCKQQDVEWGPKWLRFLIHLRFMSSKSGKIYLHSDIRMIIFRKSDLDTATAHGVDMSYELRSFTHMPTNPKFSPRK